MAENTRYGSTGKSVRDLQDRLRRAGYSPGKTDGIFGKKTQSALKKFQRSEGLKSDGISGSKTQGSLARFSDGFDGSRRPPASATSSQSGTKPPASSTAPPSSTTPAPTTTPAPSPATVGDGNLNINGRTTLSIPLSGSLQNAAWSPDGKTIAFTRFRDGYNKGPADLFAYNVETKKLTPLISDGHENVSEPGSAWTKDGRLVFSSDRTGHEEIYSIKADGSQRTPTQLTSRSGLMGYEPTLSPDAKAIAFESHVVDQEGNGRIAIHPLDGSNQYQYITKQGEDARQPNWSPAGDKILYQKHVGNSWNIWTYDVKTGQQKQVTTSGDATDATWSPDGKHILFSGGAAGGANLFSIPADGGRPVPITRYAGYDGAPSWSPNGRYVAMESSRSDPDGGGGTKLVIAPVPRVWFP
jgi:TolB protein